MMDLTIIVPHYNSTDSLKKLLATIPKRNNIEIIVVDDKSKKKERNLYDELKASQEFSHVMFLLNLTKIKGAGVCRNIGLRCAKGEWVLFADSDDFFVEGFYQIIKKYF